MWIFGLIPISINIFYQVFGIYLFIQDGKIIESGAYQITEGYPSHIQLEEKRDMRFRVDGI